MTDTQKRFKFNVPLEISKSNEDGWQIKGLASTSHKDLQGEIVDQKGLDISVLKAGRGLLNYEHSNDPQDIIGAIEDANISRDGLMIEGYLFKKHTKARAIAQIMQSLKKDQQKRVQLSIEGKVCERDESNPKHVKQAMIDRVAITFEPVNQKTYVEFAKSLAAGSEIAVEEPMTKAAGSDPRDILVTPDMQEAIEKSEPEDEEAETVEKTMTAGGGDAAPGTLTGGAAISTESLEGDTKEKKKKKLPLATMKSKRAFAGALLTKALLMFPKASFREVADIVKSEVRGLFDLKGEETVASLDGQKYVKKAAGRWVKVSE